MVSLDRNRQILNEDTLFNAIRSNGINKCRIRSKFIDREPLEVPKDDEDDYVDKLQTAILEYAKALPHRQIMLKIKKRNSVAEIIINPVTGAA